MTWKTLRRFSPLICGEPRIYTVFDEHRPTRFWWRLILRLHGKPEGLHLTRPEKLACLSAGFRFYARLVQVLAAAFLVAAAASAYCERLVPEWSRLSVALGMAAAVLWLTAGLGGAGARQFQRGAPDGTWLLTAFFILLMAMVSLFLGGVSVFVEMHGLMPLCVNLPILLLLICVGIGSYMIEVIYLVVVGRD